VSPIDQDTIRGVLNSLRDQIVTPESLCDKYSRITTLTNKGLIALVVNQTVTAIVGDSTELPFFNGAQPAGSVNFLTNSVALTNLEDGLVKYFGSVLGCTDGTIALYTRGALGKIHFNMNVTVAAFNQFVTLLVQQLTTDGVNSTETAGVTAFLNSLQPQIVFPPNVPAQSICDKYSHVLNLDNYHLMYAIVAGTEAALLANSSTAPFFNGVQPPASTDFTSNPVALKALTNQLINFFGGALGCSDGTVPPYTGPASGKRSLESVHAPMGISNQVFDDFNALLVGVCAVFGVSATDQAAILSVLQSTRGGVVVSQTYLGFPLGYFHSKGLDPGQIVAVVLCSIAAAILCAAVLVVCTIFEKKVPKWG